MELLHQILKIEGPTTYPYQTFNVIIKQLTFLHLEALKYIKLYENDKTKFFLGHPVYFKSHFAASSAVAYRLFYVICE